MLNMECIFYHKLCMEYMYENTDNNKYELDNCLIKSLQSLI
jgi:hypothetical protein